MRRLYSILLFAAILLPLIAPLLSSGAAAQSGVPACCRRDGKHHCMGGMTMATYASQEQGFHAPRMACPYQQRAVNATHHELSALTFTPDTHITRLQSPTALAQVECLRRIAFDRGRQKRGPPSLLS
jgi:hypothetical protein